MKKISILILLISVIIILFIYISHEIKREHYIKVQKARIELFFKHNLKGYKNIDIKNTYKSPMGSYNIEGTINHNKRLNFTATMTSDTNFQFEEDLTISDNIDKMFKTDSENPDFPTEIIRKTKLKSTDYEAKPPVIFKF
ncbi:DUF1433 domain-containing protein [Staphylococcus caprae]|uniref:DUF1433 domain-containing protein n=1 Tax=Staphylococcus caprae TaxID=29380 RepID=A0ABM7FRV4_9STAP|nr:DUF1433 domain-containing protein [Staphylococcus caprae]EES42286.1 hypothetical protein HMPREF0793_0060 [Staphylococcus caprae M23864:W1]MBN6826965.1 DUF1433 domain-containing protein [Staphylococcus caprae]MBX5316263.1 DUF1433 domain-containing protein [Staphylococcus caprae]MBX5324222.1 DUF1433 domain-containing protein [Staphylococcus caprae]MDI0015776.1 DUF1433 domain-containing protein [Staphylococcus caprae]